MSPRSAEFFDAARRRLEDAGALLGRDPAAALSLAYYAMLYAARAALSERDTYAKTHAGTWNLFQHEFVEGGSFDAAILAEARNVQPERERADYAAWQAPREDAERVIQLAGRFIDAVGALLGEGEPT